MVTATATRAPIISEATSKSEIAKLIRSVQKSYETSAERVQRVAVMIMEHAHKYNDCDQAKDLARAVPGHLRVGLIGWFMAYSPIGVLMGQKAVDDKSRFIAKKSNKYHDFDIEAAKADPWYDWNARNVAEPKPLMTAGEFFQNIEKLLERAVKQAENGRGGENVYDPHDVPFVIEGANKALEYVRKVRAVQLASLALSNGKEGQEETAADEGVERKAA